MMKRAHAAGCGKFAMRGLSQSLAKELQPAGVHIAHVIIDGVIGERRLVSEIALFTTLPQFPSFNFPQKQPTLQLVS
jgi:NAD(P)-dependent dehydrogenase (short-subunit alcohol dehydrogenase family)